MKTALMLRPRDATATALEWNGTNEALWDIEMLLPTQYDIERPRPLEAGQKKDVLIIRDKSEVWFMQVTVPMNGWLVYDLATQRIQAMDDLSDILKRFSTLGYEDPAEVGL